MDVLARHAKRTALLAYLAAARPRGPHQRDRLLALFWPESDAVHARAALNQALYVLRTALGEDAIVSRGDGAVVVNGDALWCDAAAFEAALDAGRRHEALALYRGDLLEGFFVTAAPEFERWLERARARLRERASQGAWALAEERVAADDPMEAARWAQRAAEFLPADEAVARRLMKFLSDLGNRAAATHAYDAFVSRLKHEYELEPSAETRVLADAIRHAESQAPEPVAPVPAAAARSVRPSTVGWRRRAALFALAAGSVLVGGWLVSRGTSETPKRLVVLPFANLGRAEDEYFADGITEEIASRLSMVGRLRVIGRTTANRYRQTEKTIPAIGKELGVAYVLEGSVRWEVSPEGLVRVKVTPRLVSTTDGTNLWAEVYDEPLDQIFRVQSDVAQQVVRALDVTLLAPQRRLVEAIPTRSLAAYDYYLRGNDYFYRALDARYAHAAVQMYEKAVALDPRFALAYARLARMNARIYWFYYDRSDARLARAKKAVETAYELQPDAPQIRLALGAYYWMVYSDYERALREFAIAEAGLPNDVDLLIPRAVLRARQGDFRSSLEDYAKARELDPGSALIAHNHAVASAWSRDFVRAESLFDRAIALSPEWYSAYDSKARLYVRWDGATQRARAVLEQAQAMGIADPLLRLDWILVDLFDRRYQAVIGRLSSDFPEVISWQMQVIPRAQLYAEAYGLLQRDDLARAYYDSARIAISARIQNQPDDARLHTALGIAYAGLGRKQEALEEGRQGVALLPVSREAERGYYREWDLARIYAMIGEHDAALHRLEYLVSIPGHLTPAWLRMDPTWDPLRGQPRFKSLAGRMN